MEMEEDQEEIKATLPTLPSVGYSVKQRQGGKSKVSASCYKASWKAKLIVWIARRLGFEETAIQVLVPSVHHRDTVMVEQLVYLKKVDRRPVMYELGPAPPRTER